MDENDDDADQTSEPELFDEPPISDAELKRRRESDQWFTTAEVLAHLEKL